MAVEMESTYGRKESECNTCRVCHVDFVRSLNSRGTVCINLQIIIYKLDVTLIS